MQQYISPNFGERRDGAIPQFVLLHYTDMATAHLALERLCDPDSQVSAHYLISRWGQVFSLVPEDMRAWHAGVGSYAGITDMNSHSIGVELDHPGGSFPDMAFASVQLQALLGLLAGIMGQWSMPLHRVVGHSDFAPGRKFDPGHQFPWAMLAAKGYGFRLPTKIDDNLRARPEDLSCLGYDLDVHQVAACVEAYAQHFMGRHSVPQDLFEKHLAATLACNSKLLR